MEQEARYLGTVYGLALGDALGAPTEFCSLETIAARWGPAGIQEPPTPALFTDDTQMTIALAEALLDAKVSRDVAQVMPQVARRFVAWSQSPENTRAPGNTCMAACRALAAGEPWERAGVTHSKGCGAPMRAAPLGLLYRERAVLRELAHASARVTHGHPAAAAATHAMALGVRLLCEGAAPQGLLAALTEETTGHAPDWDALLAAVPAALAATRAGTATPAQVLQLGPEPWRLGESWVADEAVVSALYCFLLAVERGEGYLEVVRTGANSQGDSDSIACMAGAFAGAHWGLSAIPPAWVERVELRDELGRLARRLLAARQG